MCLNPWVEPRGGLLACGDYPPPPLHPDPIEKVRQCWQEDEFFGYQFLNGTNPMLLRRSTSLPSRLVLPSGMEELQAQLEKELQVLPPTLRCSLLGSMGRSGEGEGPKVSLGREAVVTHYPRMQSPTLEKPRDDKICRGNYEALPARISKVNAGGARGVSWDNGIPWLMSVLPTPVFTDSQKGNECTFRWGELRKFPGGGKLGLEKMSLVQGRKCACPRACVWVWWQR